MRLNLDRSEKCLTPCKHCGSVWGEVKDGAGPHSRRIDCQGCGKFINWMGLNMAIRLGFYERMYD